MSKKNITEHLLNSQEVAFHVFADLAVKRHLTTAKKLNDYFKISTGKKIIKGDYKCHEAIEYTNMTAKLILDNLRD